MDRKPIQYLPTIAAVATAVGAALAPQLSALVSAHPAASIVVSCLYAILAHLAPSPIQPAQKE